MLQNQCMQPTLELVTWRSPQQGFAAHAPASWLDTAGAVRAAEALIQPLPGSKRSDVS